MPFNFHDLGHTRQVRFNECRIWRKTDKKTASANCGTPQWRILGAKGRTAEEQVMLLESLNIGIYIAGIFHKCSSSPRTKCRDHFDYGIETEEVESPTIRCYCQGFGVVFSKPSQKCKSSLYGFRRSPSTESHFSIFDHRSPISIKRLSTSPLYLNTAFTETICATGTLTKEIVWQLPASNTKFPVDVLENSVAWAGLGRTLNPARIPTNHMSV